MNLLSSFPRKRESRFFLTAAVEGSGTPAFAGVTGKDNG
jgi:hypothetical protein